MQYHWRKDNKYYRITTKTNLFGTTDVVCSWGSVTSNCSGYKIIPCKDQSDIDNTIQMILKHKKKPEEDIFTLINFNTIP